MDSTLQEISRDTKNTKIGVRTEKLCKFQNLKKISKHCSTFSMRGYCILNFSDIILAHIESIYNGMYYKLQYLSNGTKNTQIGVRMTKLWSYEVGAKTGDCSNVATLRTNVATLRTNVTTLQKQSIPTSRRWCTTSRRSGSVFGGFLAHFEPIMESFKAQTGGIEKKDGWERILGVFCGRTSSLWVETP